MRYLVLAACLIAADVSAADGGSIRGRVVNLSENEAPAAGIEVILRVRLDGEFIPVEATRSDDDGWFAFTGLPLEEDLIYLPGANRDGIHYPGPRLRLHRRQPVATVQLAIRETIAEPDPLIIRRHEIVIRAEAGALHVTEALLVDNPTPRTFVGRAGSDEHAPVTFSLGIPLDFQRLTFEKEFFGREFAVVDDRLVTSVPWEPGPRWLRFTTTVRNDQTFRRWERRLDGPSEELRVRVRHDKPEQVRCNLPAATTDVVGERVFASGETLDADYVLRVELGALPLPWINRARWVALLLLVVAIAGVSLTLRKGPARQQPDTSPAPAAPRHLAQGRRSRRRPATR
jgi:hypothetical protein